MLDKLIESVENAENEMGNTEFKIICYTDDADLISNSEDNFQNMPQTFKKTVKKYLQE